MDPQHGGQRTGRATALGAGLGIVGLDQIEHHLPGRHLLHLGQQALAPGAVLGRRLLAITESKLLAAHEPSTRL